MKTTNNTLEDVTKELLVEPLLYIMEERMEDFAEDRKKYREALCALAEEQKAKKLEEAIYRQTASMALFSGWLG